MNKLIFIALITSSSIAGCATGAGFVTDSDSAPGTRVRLELAGSSDTTAVFPRAIDPSLPSVDRIGREVRGTLGDVARAQLELCVSSAGNVTTASLVEGSGFADFDAALLRDVGAWRFSTMAGPATLQTCERAKVSYHPY